MLYCVQENNVNEVFYYFCKITFSNGLARTHWRFGGSKLVIKNYQRNIIDWQFPVKYDATVRFLRFSSKKSENLESFTFIPRSISQKHILKNV